MATFNPTTSPSIKSAGKTAARILQAPFGDGYIQRASDGLNMILDSWTFVWGLLSTAEYETIISFLEDKQGVESFDYLVPQESVTRKFICEQWSKGYPVPTGFRNLTAIFKEVADL